MQISKKRFEIQACYQVPTNGKWHMVDRMMTSSMTSHDVQRWPNIFKARYFADGSRQRLGYNWAPIGNGMDGIEWSRALW